MPSSLIIVALVVAWLLVLVPIVARRRQEVFRTADSTLAARVVRSGGVRVAVEEEPTMSTAEADTERDDEFDSGRSDSHVERVDADDDADEFVDEFSDDVDELADGYLDNHRTDRRRRQDPVDEAADDDYDSDDDRDYDSYDSDDEGGYEDGYESDYDGADDYEPRRSRPYRPGRGGFDPEAAAIAARAKYAFRQRVVVCMLLAAVVTAVGAVLALSMLWWAHAAIDAVLVGYLTYLRRQVRIENEIRQRRTARLGVSAPVEQDPLDYGEVDNAVDDEAAHVVDEAPERPPARPPMRPSRPRPGTVVVDTDDSDPIFDDLAEPDSLPYRRAVGE